MRFYVHLVEDSYLTPAECRDSDTEDILAHSRGGGNNLFATPAQTAAAAVPPCLPASPSSIGGASSSSSSTSRRRGMQHGQHTLQQQLYHFNPSNIKHELVDRLPVSQSIFTPQVSITLLSHHISFSWPNIPSFF